MITYEQASELLSYNPDTGVLSWKARTLEQFKHAKYPQRNMRIWNNRFATEPVGTTDGTGYISTTLTVDGISTKLRAHRIAYLLMTGSWPTDEIDHVDRDRTNNKWNNLRAVSPQENRRNMPKQANNTSGTTGVVVTRHGTFAAYGHIDRKKIDLGTHKTFDAAVAARQAFVLACKFHKNHGL